jgi:predicted nucleotidyltransferase
MIDMGSLDDIVFKLRGMMPDLAERYGVSGFWVFGSRARGEFRENSDVDLLVEFGRRGFSLYDFAALNLELENALGMPVDLVERDAIRQELKSQILPEAVAV